MTRPGACLMIVGAGLLLGAPATARAFQDPAVGDEAATLDPGAVDLDAPLEAMPDLGLDWPDPSAPLPDDNDAAGETIVSKEPPATVPGGVAPEPATPVLADAGALRRARLRVSGLDEVASEAGSIRAAFDARSVLLAREAESANAAQIDRRARADAELLAELLRAEGYYDAAVEVVIAPPTDPALLEVELAASAGPRFRFETVSLPGLEAAGAGADALRRAFAVAPGDPVVAADVIAAGEALRTALAESGYAGATIGERDVLVDHDRALARLTLPVQPGPVARFGAIRVRGEPPFPARHVSAIARFEPGDLYRQSDVDDLRRALVATGLIASAETRLEPRDGGETVDVEVALAPAPMRTIAGELGYGTGEGVRAEASWEHRNFFNPEGALTLRGVVGTQEQLAAISLRRNNWRKRDRVLNLLASSAHVERDAYEARTAILSAGIERKSSFLWQKPWTWSVGAELVASDEREGSLATGDEQRRTFFIGALPLSLMFDGSDSLLDPTRGFRLGGRVSPEIAFEGGASGYVKSQLDGSLYWPVSQRVIAAGRVRFGWIAGATRDDIAPSRRFYSGGGGSVRGYGYQRLGPKDALGRPIGGRSLAEFALEARIRVGSFGIVPFLDGGVLSPEARPDLADLQLGAGLGVRYYSSFGPIRVDVGTPLHREPGDSRIAVTVSLGQAF